MIRSPILDRLSRRRGEWLAFAAVAATVLGLTAWLAGEVGRSRAAEALRAQAAGSATLNVAVLRAELEKQRALPYVLSQDPDVQAALAGHEPVRIAALNAKLETLVRGTRTAVIYLIDASGTAIVSSNWREPTSFVGSNYRFRPYFTGAVTDGAAEHFALGTVSKRPGLYISRRIGEPNALLGVVVVKVEFDQVEADWGQSGAAVYVADPRGIVLLTSEPDWRFLAEAPIAPGDAGAIRASLQFGNAPLTPLPLRPRDAGTAGADFAALPDGSLQLASESAVPSTPWRLHLLLPADDALAAGARTARIAALGGAGSVLALAGLLLHRRQRSRTRAAEAVEARAELERRVEARTRDLSAANAQLTREIDERQRIEAKLQVARDELAQANRLATLGQVTAGLAHEVNQPVAAIRSYADNAVAFLDRGDHAAVRDNLATVAGLTERIGAITGTLRGFSRKATGETGPLALVEALDGALMLVGTRARRLGVALDADRPEPGLAVIANRVRLEQVLVNLLQNALDALEERPEPAIRIGLAATPMEAILTVADNGPGIAPEVLAALFTPFLTTKPRGVGLGLVISKDIVDEFGGHLAADNAPGGGACFTLTLRRAP
ncbi:sensor histidine kinase [Labrys wisconsinensis]|uniref:histidine kinase n=1 Tax=Labrys wisconsinensis TaxID=425677 RepID=A0ABU0JMN0_9HYPH|nr:ATP-binding protein [Labrys wisconsinensis]MDQ0474766.1 two-component system C4-dicarboxylate transport sensor histidine kinase DctB [Labrys wisconsinensis]